MRPSSEGWFAQKPGVLSPGRKAALTARSPEPPRAGGASGGGRGGPPGGEAAPLNHALTSPALVPAEPALRVQFCFRLQGEANNSSQVWVCFAFGPRTEPAFQRRKPSRGACPGSECNHAEAKAEIWTQARSAQGSAPEPLRLARTYRPQEHARPREGSVSLGRK